jgi:hypothetical protein
MTSTNQSINKHTLITMTSKNTDQSDEILLRFESEKYGLIGSYIAQLQEKI